jgi:hypothetical protein
VRRRMAGCWPAGLLSCLSGPMGNRTWDGLIIRTLMRNQAVHLYPSVPPSACAFPYRRYFHTQFGMGILMTLASKVTVLL